MGFEIYDPSMLLPSTLRVPSGQAKLRAGRTGLRFAIYNFVLAGIGGLGKTGKRESVLLS